MASLTSAMPHFFKIILPQTLTHGKFGIPKKFVRKHGEALQSEEVCLKVASGAKWKVGLTKKNEKVWFEKGWKEFVEFYSIQFGHFLTFRYEGNSCFHVVIFDQTTLEIEYPIGFSFGEFDEKKVFDGEINREFEMPKKSEREKFEDNDESVQAQILGNNKIKREDKMITQTLECVADDKIRIKSSDKGCGKMGICKSHVLKKEKISILLLRNQDLHYSSKFKDLKPHKVIKLENLKRKQASSRSERAKFTEQVSKLKSMSANPSFMVTMAPSYIQTGKNYLNIPIGFAKIHLKESKEINLQVLDGRVWKIWCGVRWVQGAMRVELRDGWKAFARDNSLREGDICVFELIEKNTKISFQATIFRSGF